MTEKKRRKGAAIAAQTALLLLLAACTPADTSNEPNSQQTQSIQPSPSSTETWNAPDGGAPDGGAAAPAPVQETENAEAMAAYQAVLQGGTEFVDAASGNDFALADVQELVTTDTSISIQPDSAAAVDLDGDGASELILSLSINGNNTYGFLILHYQDGTVYGYVLSQRAFSDLRTDGTFLSSGGAADTAICRIALDKTAYTVDPYIRSVSDSSTGVSYYVNGEEATQAEYEQARQAWDSTPYADWQSLMAFSGEPPLDEAAREIAVPSFLDGEQQELYRRAYSFYTHLLGDSIEYAETYDEGAFPPEAYETVTLDGNAYLIAQGRYAIWADFEAAGHSVFTEDCWQRLNTGVDGPSLRREYDGKLCFLDTSMGVGYYYCKDIPDEFRLEERTDSEITFTLIGHYRNPGGNSPEGTYDYTLEFPIKLVKTEDGWRFAEFYSALVDEEWDPET